MSKYFTKEQLENYDRTGLKTILTEIALLKSPLEFYKTNAKKHKKNIKLNL
jgi:hypothetical protein